MALASMNRAFKGIEQYPGKKGKNKRNQSMLKVVLQISAKEPISLKMELGQLIIWKKRKCELST